jgi:hypothetical protein
MSDETPTHHVNESADKITLTTKLKRGNGTRDEDRVKVKVKGGNPEATATKLHDTILAIKSENTVQELRNTRAEDEE